MADIQPGTRWVRRNGKHAGSEVKIIRTTDLGVYVINGGGGESWGNQKTDESKTNRVDRKIFEAGYVPYEAVGTNGTHGGGSFRQANPPKAKPEPEAQRPLAMNGVPLVSGNVPFNIELVEITPMQAEAWLKREVGHNRKPTKGRVRKLAGAIRRGEWMETGDSIKFDQDGNLVDGGHRLRAVIEAGIPIRSLVIRGVRGEAFTVFDTGKTRTPADTMGIAGYKNRVGVASAARGLAIIDETGRYDPGTRMTIEHLTTNAALLSYVEKHPEIHRAVELAVVAKGNGLSGGPGLMGTFFALLLRVDAKAAEIFIDQLSTGLGLEADSPIYLYRRRLISEQRMSASQSAREHLLALGIKAWNAWRNGEHMQVLTWHAKRSIGSRSGEDFPVPV